MSNHHRYTAETENRMEREVADYAQCSAQDLIDPKIKDTNPKEAIGSDKLPLDLVPDTAIALECLALLDGALKYGKWNWRAAGVRHSTYWGALRRHMMAYENGEDIAPDGVHHLAHMRACLSIIIDAKACGKLTDDRPPGIVGGVAAFIENLTQFVPLLKKRHAGKTPKHWTINDQVPQ